MSLVQHAKEELTRAGLFDKDSDYDGMLGNAVLELVEKFAAQGHSGFSAGMTLEIFNRVARFRTLTPISSNPTEWMEVTQYFNGKGVWQNRRDPAKFSEDGGKTWYDVDERNSKWHWKLRSRIHWFLHDTKNFIKYTILRRPRPVINDVMECTPVAPSPTEETNGSNSPTQD
jgi:hypothetical protein